MPCRKRNGPVAGAVTNEGVGDEGFGRPSSGRLSPRRFAPCALRRKTASPFPRLRALTGSNPRMEHQTENGPVAGAVTNEGVGDEGFEPPALCV